jgi:hypothetical protein|tara:strand:- start:4672 stop:4992 length:321 start_codon:yes stop_codon:yes gene_type:complete
MSQLYLLLAVSLVLNGALIWYLIKLLRKFVFISENLADLYLITRAFQVFAKNMYSMDTYHGEPMIQELIFRMKEVNEEINTFREIFEHSLDEVLEEELNAAEEEEK